MRLDKFLAEASVGTRKKVRCYVKDGLVTVNGQIVTEPASDINIETDFIRFLDNEVIYSGKHYYMFHKPAGCVTARTDKECKTVLDYINSDERKGLFPVGRLDKDTEGLLLLTNDGEFSHKLMYPDKHVEKTYFFWAFGKLESTDLEHLITGIDIGEDDPLVKAISIEVVEEGFYEELAENIIINNAKNLGQIPQKQPVVSGYLTITEGRKHQVKRMLKAVGCYVVYLKRVSIGDLMLDETLKKGQYRQLTQEEIKNLLDC